MATTEPYMSLILPTIGIDTGLFWEQSVNSNSLIVGGHDHSPGSGVPVTPFGLDISSNLNIQNNELTNVYGITFSASAPSIQTQFLYTAPQTGGGINDLFYNDGAGNVIPLTKGGIVNAVASSIPGESYASGTFTWKQGSGSTTPANFDIGSVTIRPNVAATTYGVVLNPPAAISSQYDLQLPVVPSVTSIMQLDSSGNELATLVPDNSTIVISSQILSVGTITGSNISAGSINASVLTPQSITQNLLALRSTGTTVAAGGVAVSHSSGNFSAVATSPTPVTNLSVTITTTGRPVQLLIQGNSGSESYIAGTSNFTGASYIQVYTYIYNTATLIYESLLVNTVIVSPATSTIAIYAPPSVISFLDMSINGSPGTYTYSVSTSSQVDVGQAASDYSNCVLIAYEI